MKQAPPRTARARRRVLVAAALLALLLGGGAWVARQAPAWLWERLTPQQAFDPARVPPAPDYARDEAWLALPSRPDEADVALAELPAARAPLVDVFYVHPTSSVAPQWNAPWDDPQVRAASIRGGTLIQASAFNGAGAVYAPTYRQASGAAFTTPSPSATRAIELAYGDVAAAFQEFLRRSGGARPFLLVGHSQGAALAARLLREQVVNSPLRERLVAAYLMGMPLGAADVGGLPACASRDATGCVVSFNLRGPEHRPDRFEATATTPAAEQLCVNPVLGRATDEVAPRASHAGALFFDAEAPALLPAFTSCACRDGRLIALDPLDLPWRGLPSAALLWVLGGQNFHPVEVQVFYADLRADAARRAAAHLAKHPPPPG